jgi:hypothetical protein
MVVGMSNFPEHILKDCKTALCLFAAAYGGENDVQYIHKAGIKNVILVDEDKEKMKLMEHFGYRQTIGDAFHFIDRAYISLWRYELIVSDQYTHDDFKVWALYPELKKMAKKYLIIGVCENSIKKGLKLPEGELMKRSDYLGGVYWHITKI